MSIFLMSLLSGCVDFVVSRNYTDPELRITVPEEGAVVRQHELVAFTAEVGADGRSAEDYTYAWRDAWDDGAAALAGEAVLDGNTVQMVVRGLAIGHHRVEIEGFEEGYHDEDWVNPTVAFEVIEDAAPSVTFASPSNGGRFASQLDVEVLLEVTDDDPVESVVLSWTGTADGAPASPEEDGTAAYTLSDLAEGGYAIQVTATDALDLTATASVVFQVVDGDGDGDGHVDRELGGDDCDDDDASVLPTAVEICDGIDNDCDEEIDEDDAIDASTWYLDGDGDGYGDENTTHVSCEPPSGYTDVTGDCNDSEKLIHPAAREVCDGVDNNCDGSTDGADATGATTWYADTDTDGFGDPENTLEACDLPSGHVADDTDCNDGDIATYPGADETCDDLDNDCDEEIDEDPIDPTTWSYDHDGDGYGDADSQVEACDAPSGYVADDTDCDDRESTANPAGTESCVGGRIDEDCDGLVDEGCAVDFADVGNITYGEDDYSELACGAGVDLDGDGVDELLVTAPRAINPDLDTDGREAGGAYFLDAPGVPDSAWLGDADMKLYGDTINGDMGRVCAVGGDYDADGLGDGLVGFNEGTDSAYAQGAVLVVSGSATGELGPDDALARWWGEYNGDYAGNRVVWMGDVDGDGSDDLATAASGYDAGHYAGRVYVVGSVLTGD